MTLTAADIDRYVGQRLRQRRQALGLSQAALGRRLGLTFSQVQKYEKGSNRIGAGRLYLLAQFLDVPIDHFFADMGAAAPGRPRAAEAEADELATLERAFHTITDPEVRGRFLALACSLAAPYETPEDLRRAVSSHARTLLART